MSIPTSFDFDGQALRPDYVVKCSYGNDSIALIQWLHEYDQQHPLGKVVVLYNDTGWAANWWPGRVLNGEKLARSYGFIPSQTKAIPWQKLLRKHGAWPDRLRRFCTEELKIIPTHHWLSVHDPDGKSEMICGVRREESKERANWPEYVESSPKNEGRSEWSPLVLYNAEMRDALILRAGWKPLPHRSRECRCVLANATDISTWSEADLNDIEAIEKWLGQLYPGKNKNMFHPDKKEGHPEGIRAVQEWAKRVIQKREDKTELEPSGGCDSGYCTG